MKYYLGIDGGGTKTKVWVINQKEETIFTKTAGASSIDTVTSDATLKHVTMALDGIKSICGNDFEFTSIFAGIGGITTKEDEENVAQLLRQLPGASENTKIIARNDMEIALASGLCGDGIALIVGTGMVAFGKKGEETHKCAGWGYKEGETGSGYDLGMQAIRMMIRAYDHRIEGTAFTEEVFKTLGMNKVTDIVAIINNLWGKRTKIAALAPLVTKHANLNDPHALEIIKIAANEVFLAIKGVYKSLNMQSPPLVIIGSLGNAPGVYRNMIIERVLELDPNINITAPKIDPAQAAAFLALKS
jgi:N-acetylglucosamine kinase-like BadF-type ATPase